VSFGIQGFMGIDIGPYSRGMLQATQIAQLFPATVTNFIANPLLGIVGIAKDVVGAVESAVDAVIDNVKRVGKAADDAGEAAERAGVSVRFLTSVGAAAADSGSSVEGLGDALKFLNRNAASAAEGDKELTKEFLGLGVAVLDATGKIRPTEDLFFDVADAIAAVDDPAKKTKSAMALLGRGGTDMIPLLNKGAGAIRAFAAEVDSLGGSIDEELAASGDKFGMLTTLYDAAIAGIQRTAARPFLSAMANHFDEIVHGIEAGSGIIRHVIEDVFAEVNSRLGRPTPATLLKYLDDVAAWVRDNPAAIRAEIGRVIDFIVEKFGQARSAIGWVIDNAKSLAYVMGAAVLGAAAIQAVSSISSIIASLALLKAAYASTALAAAGASLAPGAAGAGGAAASAATGVLPFLGKAAPIVGGGIALAAVTKQWSDAISKRITDRAGSEATGGTDTATVITQSKLLSDQIDRNINATVEAAGKIGPDAAAAARRAKDELARAQQPIALEIAELQRRRPLIAAGTDDFLKDTISKTETLFQDLSKLRALAQRKSDELGRSFPELETLARAPAPTVAVPSAVDAAGAISATNIRKPGPTATIATDNVDLRSLRPLVGRELPAVADTLQRVADAARGPFTTAIRESDVAIKDLITDSRLLVDVLDQVKARYEALAAPAAAAFQFDPSRFSLQPSRGGASGGGGGVTINNPVFPKVDVDEASTQIAAKIRPMIRDAVDPQFAAIHAAAQSERVKRGL
jgi:hypothetical protein